MFTLSIGVNILHAFISSQTIDSIFACSLFNAFNTKAQARSRLTFQQFANYVKWQFTYLILNFIFIKFCWKIGFTGCPVLLYLHESTRQPTGRWQHELPSTSSQVVGAKQAIRFLTICLLVCGRERKLRVGSNTIVCIGAVH